MHVRTRLPYQLAAQVVALLLIVAFVHGVYSLLIRPQAARHLTRERELIADGVSELPPRPVVVVLKDGEQEACFVLMFWAFAILVWKGMQVQREARSLGENLLGLDEGTSILPEDSTPLIRRLESLPPAGNFVSRVLVSALRRYNSARDLENVAGAIDAACTQEGDRLESELSMIRYIAWAIPSVGFIGTVRGIGMALGNAHQAVGGDISAVTESLGVAFNSTLVALFISILLMFVVHQLQRAQEQFVLEARDYCDEHLIRRLHTR